MAISPIGLRVAYISEGFPAGSTPNGAAELNTNWDEIVWSALTIGRPTVHHVFLHGRASIYEAIFRISLVRMALEQAGPSARRLRRTAAYKGLDPTEKGAISYFLGMTFCKLFASRLLATPWLLHLDVFKGSIPTRNLGRSRPDLIGENSTSGSWSAFETKGRASKPSHQDRLKAKMQALRLVSVNGQPCSLHVGTFSYFVNDILQFHWVDPIPKMKDPIEASDPNKHWGYYYGPAQALWAAKSGGDGRSMDGTVSVPEQDIILKIHPLLLPYFESSEFNEAKFAMIKARSVLEADGFQPDGLQVKCGPSWRVRESERVPEL
jgi:hypothetical protein